MKVYFDESYPTDAKIMILGALFLPNNTASFLHKKILTIKNKKNITGELKYSKIQSKRQLGAAKEIVDNFFAMKDGYFRASILPYNERGLSLLTGGNLDKKRVGIYADSATKLIINNVSLDSACDVFMDEESRLEKVKFHEKLKKIKLQNGTKLNSVTAVKSHHDGSSLMTLCDLLTGGILQNLYPSKSESEKSKFKKEFGKYYLSKVDIEDFGEETWNKIKTSWARKKNMKVHIGYWHIPDFAKYIYRKSKKSRS
jgi:hypothetical protein